MVHLLRARYPLERSRHRDCLPVSYTGLSKGSSRKPSLSISQQESVEIQGDLGGDKEKLVLRFVRPQGKAGRVEPDRASPILVLGDSHVLVFHDGGDMHATGAGLPDQLALELGAPVDVLGVRGSGATSARVSLARRARASSDYLSGKKVIIWCFGARELTQADAWKSVPLMKPAGTFAMTRLAKLKRSLDTGNCSRPSSLFRLAVGRTSL